MVIRDTGLIHPRAIKQFGELALFLRQSYEAGATHTRFEVFETYRTPERQMAVQAAGNSKAGAYSSAHQFGLAVDFVPKVKGVWTWEGRHDWDFLRAAATRLGLKNNLNWDRAHVEHPIFEGVLAALRY